MYILGITLELGRFALNLNGVVLPKLLKDSCVPIRNKSDSAFFASEIVPMKIAK